jgi:hypothetical protein
MPNRHDRRHPPKVNPFLAEMIDAWQKGEIEVEDDSDEPWTQAEWDADRARWIAEHGP